MTAPALRECTVRLTTRPEACFAFLGENGARIPSMAEDVATELRTLRRRTAASRRYGFDAESLQLMELV